MKKVGLPGFLLTFEKKIDPMQRGDDANTYWISGDEQFECLMSARRLSIVGQLANSGPKSIREIAKLVGAKPSALYHHMELLLGVGLVEEAGKRVVSRRQEVLYQTPGSVMRYGLRMDDPAAIDIYKRLGGVQCRQAERDFVRGLESGEIMGAGPTKNAWLFRLVGAPDDETLEKINGHIEAIADLIWSSVGQDNPLVVISGVMTPVPNQNGE